MTSGDRTPATRPAGAGQTTGRDRDRLRVAAHSGGATFGGTETWTARFLAGLQERGHHVHLYCRDRAMAERYGTYGVPVSVCRLGGDLMVPDAVRLARHLRAFGPDTLLCLTFRKIWLAGLAGRLARVPSTLFRVANQGTYPRHALYRFSFRRLVDQVVCNADELRLPFLAHAPGVDPRRVITVYDGVEAAAAPDGPAIRQALGWADRPVVGSVGRLVRQKRFDRLLDTLALLPDVRCLLAGDGSEREALEGRARRLGLSDRVRFLGHRSDVPAILASIDLFLVTSDFEGMSNAMLEAMSMGVPVVSTPVSGAREALRPEGGAPAGRVVEPRPEALAAAIRELLEDEKARAAAGAAARERHREAFSFDGMLDGWERLLLGEPPAGLHQGASPLVP